MNNPSIINCGVPECGRSAQMAAILGTQRFCMVPAMENIADPLPLVRFNLCDKHLFDVRSNFIEVVHDPLLSDYRDINESTYQTPMLSKSGLTEAVLTQP